MESKPEFPKMLFVKMEPDQELGPYPTAHETEAGAVDKPDEPTEVATYVLETVRTLRKVVTETIKVEK